MAIFAGITGLVSVIVGCFVTWRLFALARRTRAVPERLLAVSFLGLSCVGFPLTGASRAPGMVMTHEGALLFALGSIGMVVGIAALSRFPYVVFRPGRRGAAGLALAISACGAIGGAGAATVVAVATTREAMIADIQPWTIALMASVAGAYGWNAVESLHYYRKMKRRAALGLANAETTHRFLLWALASGAAVGSILVMIGMRAAGLPILAPLGASLIACTSCVATICWWLAFFMPDAYRRKVLGVAAGRDERDARTSRGSA